MIVVDALGQTIHPGDTVAYSRRYGSSLSITKRKVHGVDEKLGVKMYEEGTDRPSRTWANSWSMVVVDLKE